MKFGVFKSGSFFFLAVLFFPPYCQAQNALSCAGHAKVCIQDQELCGGVSPDAILTCGSGGSPPGFGCSLQRTGAYFGDCACVPATIDSSTYWFTNLCYYNSGNIEFGSCNNNSVSSTSTSVSPCTYNSGTIGPRSCSNNTYADRLCGRNGQNGIIESEACSDSSSSRDMCYQNNGVIGMKSCGQGSGQSRCYSNSGEIGQESCAEGSGSSRCHSNSGEIGMNSCAKGSGENRCHSNRGIIGNSSCVDGSGRDICHTNGGEIEDESCNGGVAGKSDYLCRSNGGVIEQGSCINATHSCTSWTNNCGYTCGSNYGTIEQGACLNSNGTNQCSSNSGTLGRNSCNDGIGDYICNSNRGTIDEASCSDGQGNGICQDNTNHVGSKSCNFGGPGTCQNNRGPIGNHSCNQPEHNTTQRRAACFQNKGSIGDFACNAKNACDGISAQVTIGNFCCNFEDACDGVPFGSVIDINSPECFPPAVTTQLAVAGDTFVWEATPDASYDKDSFLSVGSGSPQANSVSFIHFSGFAKVALEMKESIGTVTSAQMVLTDAGSDAGDTPIVGLLVDQSTIDQPVDWNNPLSNHIEIGVSIFDAQGGLTMDLTGIIRSRLESNTVQDDLFLALKVPRIPTGGLSSAASFHSSESYCQECRPKLALVYTPLSDIERLEAILRNDYNEESPSYPSVAPSSSPSMQPSSAASSTEFLVSGTTEATNAASTTTDDDRISTSSATEHTETDGTSAGSSTPITGTVTTSPETIGTLPSSTVGQATTFATSTALTSTTAPNAGANDAACKEYYGEDLATEVPYSGFLCNATEVGYCVDYTIAGTCTEEPSQTEMWGKYTVQCPIAETRVLNTGDFSTDFKLIPCYGTVKNPSNNVIAADGVMRFAWQGKALWFWPTESAQTVSSVLTEGTRVRLFTAAPGSYHSYQPN